MSSLEVFSELIDIKKNMVPKAGLEPAWIAPHAPQTCVSTSSTTSAQIKYYYIKAGVFKQTGHLL
jgi:hypothetical protein